MTTAKHKKGDTFRRAGVIDVTDYGVTVTDMTGWIGRCQIRDSFGALVATLTFTWINSAARQCEIYCANTIAWGIGKHRIDIELQTPAGDIVSTDTTTIEVIDGVTRV